MIELHIKNMVCGRCIKSVTDIFNRSSVAPVHIELGKITLPEEPSGPQLVKIKEALLKDGFELLDDSKTKLVEEIKKLIINLVHYGELDGMKENLSAYLSGRLHKDYNYLSNLFSSIENNTIEQFFILQKIEKIKEWLVYDELTLSEMSFRLGYSSSAHLSNQFKKITGFTPTQFKKLKNHHRKPLDKI
ncbi:MAG: AraC family transcriptional regulator [Bacteroidota bacterium]